MAKPLTISIPHNLGKAEARRRLETGFAAAAGQAPGFGMFGFQQRWEQDVAHFEATGFFQKMTGRLEVTDDAVRIELDLPAILAALADKITTGLKSVTQKLLEKK
jgi:hypothetical protein